MTTHSNGGVDGDRAVVRSGERHAEGTIAVEHLDRQARLHEARSRFGGIDVPATLVGMLTALALLTLIAGLVAAAVGAIGYQTGVAGNQAKLSIGGLVGGLALVRALT